jgi:hypothetical protein
MVLLLWPAVAAGQVTPVAPGNLAERLMVDNRVPGVVRLSREERSVAVAQLEEMRRGSRGKRLQEASYLLAALGSDYEKNRDYLLGVLRNCGVPDTDCDDETAEFLIQLYKQGHHEVLHALMVAGLKSDGALSETLGDFYYRVLMKAPAAFLGGVRGLDARTQKAVCGLAGGVDGGGMPPEDLSRARRELRRMGHDVALRCLGEVEESNREIEAGKE